MTTYRLVKRPKSSIVTLTFDSYNKAVSFIKASSALNPSKPFKKGLDWHVSFINPTPESGVYARVDHWEKPGVYFGGEMVYSSHGEWRGVEGLKHLGAEPPPVKPKPRIPEPLRKSPLRSQC